MKTIKNLTEVTSLNASDEFLVSTVSGNDRRVKHSVVLPNTSPNAVFRGKNLGTLTADNIDTFIADHGISTGAFTDIFVGDYYTINYNGANKTIRIAGANLFIRNGDTMLSSNHIVCVPEGILTTASMNSTNTTNKSENEENTSEYGAYIGSDMWNITIPKVNETLEAIFGGHLLTYRSLLSDGIDPNAVAGGLPNTTGASNKWDWFDCKANLMSEVELYGSKIFGSAGYDYGIGNKQFPIFSLEPQFIQRTREWFWLRNVASSVGFCGCGGFGGAYCGYASFVYGVRPFWLLG
jgi:hypothetical protein